MLRQFKDEIDQNIATSIIVKWALLGELKQKKKKRSTVSYTLENDRYRQLYCYFVNCIITIISDATINCFES